MSLRRYSGMVGAISLGLCLSVCAFAQGTLAEVTATADAEPAPATELTDAHGPAAPGDAGAGAGKAAACAACHGADGNSADAQYPKLAGQHERYIARQLGMFKDGSRDNAIMLGFASILSPQDMRDIGAYFATQTPLAGLADDTPIAEGPHAGQRFYEVGQAIYRGGDASRGIPACLACHGPTGRGNPGSAYPSLAGQHAAYTTLHLEAFRAGHAWGRDETVNTVMVDVAKQLTDEEIRSLASYIEGLHAAAPEVAAQ